MKPSTTLQTRCEDARRLIARYRVRNPRIFGSTLRGDDADGSDLDLLVDPVEQTTFFDLVTLEKELSQLLGVPVDVQTPGSLSRRFRHAVLAEAKPL
jgi:uncharacterized protein